MNDHTTNNHTAATALTPGQSGRPVHRALAAAAALGQQRVALVGEGDLADIATLVAREHAIKIVGVVSWTGEAGAVAAAIAALGPVDAAFITTVVQAQDAFDAVRAAVGADHVYAPGLLRLRKAAPVNGSAEALR